MSTFLNILYNPDYCGLLVRFITVWLVGLVLGDTPLARSLSQLFHLNIENSMGRKILNDEKKSVILLRSFDS